MEDYNIIQINKSQLRAIGNEELAKKEKTLVGRVISTKNPSSLSSMIHNLLEVVANDFSTHKTPQSWIQDTVHPRDINALREQAAANSQWDAGKIRLNLWEQWLSGDKTTDIRTFSSGPHKVIVLGKTPVQPPPPSWIRIFRLLSPDKPVRVIWFASDEKRIPPPVGEEIKPQHINGGYTERCNSQSVVIYRKEEATRVLIHELLHASCTDPTGTSTTLPEVEADTEAWAEIVLTAIKARGSQQEFNRLWTIQAQYAVHSAETAATLYKVKSQSDYGWRYLTGRLESFKRFGLPLPSPGVGGRERELKTLRLTHEKLEPDL